MANVLVIMASSFNFDFVISQKICGLPVGPPLVRQFAAAINVARSAKAPTVEHLPNGPSTKTTQDFRKKINCRI
jgi:hypothetical protein